MKPVTQSPDGTPGTNKGDCFRACVASVLELELTDLPIEFFGAHLEKFHSLYNQWLVDNLRMQMIEWYVNETTEAWCGPEQMLTPTTGFWIATVNSLNLPPDENGEPAKHAVVMEGLEIAWDPSREKKRENFYDGSPVYYAKFLVPLDPSVGISPADLLQSTGT